MYVQDVVEKKLTNLAYNNTKAEQSRSDDKVSHIRSTQEKLCDDRIETRLKQNREVKEQCEDDTKRSNARGSQSEVMKKK